MFTKIGLTLAPFFQTSNAYILPPATGVDKAILSGKSSLGNSYYIKPQVSGGSYNFIGTELAENSQGYAVGSSDTPATDSDYTLGTQITGLTGSVTTTTEYDSTNYRYVTRNEFTISNATGSDVTIKEIGRFVTCQTSSTRGSTTSSSPRSFMTEHTILETPVTIPNGEAGVIRCDYIYPTSV